MRVRMKSVVGVVLVVIGLSLPAWETASARTVRVGVYDNNPLVFLDAQGVPKGIFIDLLAHVAGRELQHLPDTWTAFPDRLDSGEIDLQAAITFSEERGKNTTLPERNRELP